jgi:hypothetical protein
MAVGIAMGAAVGTGADVGCEDANVGCTDAG